MTPVESLVSKPIQNSILRAIHYITMVLFTRQLGESVSQGLIYPSQGAISNFFKNFIEKKQIGEGGIIFCTYGAFC